MSLCAFLEISSLVLFIFNTESNSTFTKRKFIFFRLFYIENRNFSRLRTKKEIEKRKKLLKIENF